MKRFFENKTGTVLIIATVILAVITGVGVALSGRDKAGVAENVLNSITEPGQIAVTETGNWFTNIFSYFGSIKALKEENELLKQQNIALDKQLRDSLGYEKENYDLRQMLDLVEKDSSLDLLPVRITAKNPSNWYSTFTINKGAKDGVQKNQPVITTNKELIGQVYNVGTDWAEIVTVFDTECGVSSIVERSGDMGIVEGDVSLGFKGYCRLGYMSRNTDVTTGDYIETSGLGGVYPKGILIGKVVDVTEDNVSMSKSAIVEPFVDFGKIKDVFVLTSFVDDIERKPSFDDTDKDNFPDEENQETNDEEDDEMKEDGMELGE